MCGVVTRGVSDSCDRQVSLKCDEKLGERWTEIARVLIGRDGRGEGEKKGRERKSGMMGLGRARRCSGQRSPFLLLHPHPNERCLNPVFCQGVRPKKSTVGNESWWRVNDKLPRDCEITTDTSP